MVYVRVKEILKEKKKTKYWFVKKMEGGYQALSHLMDNETSGIHFATLEKLCSVLECEPGDILVLKKRKEMKNGRKENIAYLCWSDKTGR